MKLILSGGGCGTQTSEQYELYSSIVNKEKPLLYVPLAMHSSSYNSCKSWITDELEPYGLNNIHMVETIDELMEANLNNYNSIFIGGGNTYKLLQQFKKSDFISKLSLYLENDGVVFGGSAGAIIFGYDIDICKLDDLNENENLDLRGLNKVNDYIIACHFDDDEKKKRDVIQGYVTRGVHVIGLPEESALYVNNDQITIIGQLACKVFKAYDEYVLEPGNQVD